MTDHPRFEPVSCRPGEAHRRYHGGCLVDWVFAIVDHRALRRPTDQAPRTIKFEVGVPIALVLLLVGALAGLIMPRSHKAPSTSSVLVTPANGLGAHSPPENDMDAHRRQPHGLHLHADYTP